MKITNEGAINLLGAICQTSATEFEKALRNYVMISGQKKKARRNLDKAMQQYAELLEREDKALKAIRKEADFLNGNDTIQPMINGNYVCVQLIKSIMETLDENSIDILFSK